jgi:galactonate dehydratase
MRIDSGNVHLIYVDKHTVWVFLELIADGLHGFGEALITNKETVLAEALRLEIARLKGQDVEVATTTAKPLAGEKFTGLLEATVHATVDQALWDLRAQAAGLPLYQMLGPTLRTSIKLYANINRGTRDRTPEGFAIRAKAAIDDGFEGVKLAPFDGLGRANAHTQAGRTALELGIERVNAVRAAIGDAPRLMVDCHSRFGLANALTFLERTAHTRIDWFEDALPYDDLDAWVHLRAVSPAPLVGGETARGVKDLLPFMERGIWDVVMPDIRFFGGVTELLALTPLVEQFQIQLAPHNPRGPIATLTSGHVMASCPVFDHLEYQYKECEWRDAKWREQLGYGAEVIQGGHLQLSSAPGIGFMLNTRYCQEHLARPD